MSKNTIVERDGCKVCRHLKRWHHGAHVPVTPGKIGRSAECRRCYGKERHHEFLSFHRTKRK